MPRATARATVRRVATGAMDPSDATGIVVSIDGDGKPRFLGTCFALLTHLAYVTAAHCVEGRDVAQLAVLRPDAGGLRPASRVACHPEADLAVVVADVAGV